MRPAVCFGRASLAVVALGALTAVGACRSWLVGTSRHRVLTDPAQVDAEVGVVLGAGLRPDGSPTGLLARRVEAGVALYRRGSVGRLIMSGADDVNGDQPAAMAELAIALGVPAELIELDRTGVNTAATCRRVALDHPHRPVALITQAFHAHRTAYLAARAGLDAVVFASPDAEVRRIALLKARLRELPAAVKATFVDRF